MCSGSRQALKPRRVRADIRAGSIEGVAMRFGRKLAIILVVLTLVPVVGTALLVSSLVSGRIAAQVDGRLDTALAGPLAAYRSEVEQSRLLARRIASDRDVQVAFAQGSAHGLALGALAEPPFNVALIESGRTLAGSTAPVVGWRTSVAVGRPSAGRRVVLTLPLDPGSLRGLAARAPLQPDVRLMLLTRKGGRQPVLLPLDRPGRLRVSGTAYRGLAVALPVTGRTPAYLVAGYRQDKLDGQIAAARWRVAAPAIVIGILLLALSLVTAARISRALRTLAERASALVDTTDAEDGDELTELSTVLDTISTRLDDKADELELERSRLRRTLSGYGETLAATHDMDALLSALLGTALQATRARGGRVLLHDPERGRAVEQVRVGSARGSRADLPMMVKAGLGLEGMALRTLGVQSSDVPRPILAAPIVLGDEALGVVTVVDPEAGSFATDDSGTLASLAQQAGVAIRNVHRHEQAQRAAASDGLTGLANRRHFYDSLRAELERSGRFGHPLGLVLLDVDNFKRINDTRGHLAGDAVLKDVASVLASSVRDVDLAARYGGEEFAVLLPETDAEGAARLAERLRAAIEAHTVSYEDGPIEGVTASFGVACCSAPSGDGFAGQTALIGAADAALYRAKNTGKNRVVAAADTALRGVA
jgi:diguanylate cyclase (GGDEF)-like protein